MTDPKHVLVITSTPNGDMPDCSCGLWFASVGFSREQMKDAHAAHAAMFEGAESHEEAEAA